MGPFFGWRIYTLGLLIGRFWFLGFVYLGIISCSLVVGLYCGGGAVLMILELVGFGDRRRCHKERVSPCVWVCVECQGCFAGREGKWRLGKGGGDCGMIPVAGGRARSSI